MKIKTLKTRFIITFVVSLLAVFFAAIITFEVSFRITANNYIQSSISLMQNDLDESITEIVNESSYLYARIMRSENAALLRDISDETKGKQERDSAFKSLIQRAGINEEYFDDVVLILEDRQLSLSDSGVTLSASFENLYRTVNVISYVGTNGQSVITGVYTQNIVSDFCGVFLFYIAEERISEMCASSEEGEGYSFIMRSDGLIASHPQSELLGKSIIYSDIYNTETVPVYKTDKIDGVRRIIVINSASTLNARYDFDSYIVSVLDYEYYFGGMEFTVNILLITAAAVFVVAALIAVWCARKISRPITALSQAINGITEPTKEHISVLSADDELVQLERNYDDMMDRIYDLVEKNRQDMQMQRKLELDSLQMQINPHFLYNTLDAISWMAKIKKQPEIDRLVMNLAKFFRLFLHNGDKYVTVSEEIELVKSYLEINEIRFPGKISTHICVDEDVAEQMTLKLILQPLVENCVKYAFTQRNGNIWIRAYSDGGDIILEVRDDGEGFDVPPDILTRPPLKDSGYGLKNVNERIRLQYGDDYGLSVQSEIGKGTKFTVKIKKTFPE